jgi:phage FluMu protein Com
MITITCDKCERLLSVENDLAGSKIACPHCGDINVVPQPGQSTSTASQSTSPARADRASTAGYPPDSGPEQRVKIVHPAVIRAHPFSILGLWTLILLSAVGVIYLGLIRNSTAWLIGSGVILLAALATLGVWKVLSLSETLEITNKRSVLRRGLLSKATTEVVHDDIRNFQITQTFLQRVLKVGTIGISSAGQDAVEIVMHDAPHPEEVRKVIDLYRSL